MDVGDLENLRNICVKIVTGREDVPFDQENYEKLRSEFISDPLLNDIIPPFIKNNPDRDSFFLNMQIVSPNNRGRREYLAKQFGLILEEAQKRVEGLILPETSQSLYKNAPKEVAESWSKAVTRAASDPSGSITSSRSTIESTLKFILTDSRIEYKDSEDLGGLASKVERLIFPSLPTQTEDIKRLLGSLRTVIDKVKTGRDSYGDAHGHHEEELHLDSKFARLYANLSGTVSWFLLEAYAEYKLHTVK